MTLDPETRLANRLGANEAERAELAEEYRQAVNYRVAYEEGETELETAQNQQKARMLESEYRMADLNEIMAAEGPETAWTTWNRMLRENPEACPRLAKVFREWDTLFPAEEHLPETPIWERVPIYWDEHVPWNPEEIDPDELRILEETFHDLFTDVVLSNLAARISGSLIPMNELRAEEDPLDPNVTWEFITQPLPEKARPLSKAAWEWMTPEELDDLLEREPSNAYLRVYQTQEAPVPQWMWQWLDSKPNTRKKEIMREVCQRRQQDWEEMQH